MKRSTLHPNLKLITGTVRGGSWLSARHVYKKLIDYILLSGRVPN
ncbi:MAG TPA: hypothetical protein PKW14_11695 [Bacteroidota bacterium]|nr:hypothetical protein [Bacteroidota bacterium]